MAAGKIGEDFVQGLSDLPTEVLEIVFLNVLDRNAFHFFHLAKTCRRFRDVIFHTLVPPLCEGKMSHSTALSVCGLIDESVAGHWTEEDERYYPKAERTPTMLAQSFLAFHTFLKVDNPRVILDELAGDIPNRATLPAGYTCFEYWKNDSGITFRKQAEKPKLITTTESDESHDFIYLGEAPPPHIQDDNWVVFHKNIAKGTFGIYVDLKCDFFDSSCKSFKMYDAQAAFQGGHVTACHMFFNTLCLGTSNGRIYAFCVKRLDDLYELDLSKPDYMTKVGQAKAIRQIEITVGPTGSIDIIFSHKDKSI